jgi:hypothetical protein
VETCVEDLALDVGRLLPLGMIVQELIAISLEQAFPAGRSGIISLAAYKDAAGQIEVVLSDDGVEPKAADGIPGAWHRPCGRTGATPLGDRRFCRRGGTTYRIRFPRGEAVKRPLFLALACGLLTAGYTRSMNTQDNRAARALPVSFAPPNGLAGGLARRFPGNRPG